MSHLSKDPMNTVARKASFLGAITANATLAGTGFSAMHAEDVVLAVNIGTVGGGGTATVKLQDAPRDPDGSDPETGDYSDVVGASVAITAANDGRLVRIRARKSMLSEFVRGQIVCSGGGTVDFCSGVLELHGIKYDQHSDGSPDSPLTEQATTKFDVNI